MENRKVIDRLRNMDARRHDSIKAEIKQIMCGWWRWLVGLRVRF